MAERVNCYWETTVHKAREGGGCNRTKRHVHKYVVGQTRAVATSYSTYNRRHRQNDDTEADGYSTRIVALSHFLPSVFRMSIFIFRK
jgi:hypothetical protein